MIKFVVTAATAASIVLAATAQSPAPAPPARKAPVHYRLLTLNNSGERGTATLFDGAKGLIVKLRMEGSGDVDQPAHIHKGTCDKLDPKPTYPLKSVHDGVSETTIPDVTLAQLDKAPYAINVHKSGKEIPVYVSCGNIVAPK